MSTAEELALVDAAISTVLNGGVAEFREGQHGAKLLNYKDLSARRDQLLNQLAMESGGILMPVREVRRESPY